MWRVDLCHRLCSCSVTNQTELAPCRPRVQLLSLLHVLAPLFSLNVHVVHQVFADLNVPASVEAMCDFFVTLFRRDKSTCDAVVFPTPVICWFQVPASCLRHSTALNTSC